MVTSGALEAALFASKPLKMQLSADRLTAEVTVPEGVASVTVQRFQRVGGWQKVITATAVSGVMKFNLPANGKKVRWRAVGWFEKGFASRDKFPASFYKGFNRFGAVKSGVGPRMGLNDFLAPPGARTDVTAGATTDVPVEADIWKVDGDTVYFFNQLRGLQILDLTNPGDPRITASLRLPAVGHDLYVLPGSSGADRTVVLLTEGWSQEGGQWTRINLVRVSGGRAEITYTQDVTGSLADSRMVGNRLILATSEWNNSNGVSSNGWSSKARLTEWLLAADKAPQAAGETLIEGNSPLIASGPDWLALAVHPDGQWNVSEVSVFAVRPTGLVRMARPVRTTGTISSKFGMQWSGNVLTTISESNWSGGRWAPTTLLENFRAWAPEVIHPMVVEDRLGMLELAKGERLFATRFAGDKAYVVTFLQTDPLWVVDLSDPKNPVVAGHIEVPGWSTHLEPIGDLLFSIGWESGSVVASLFDVAAPADPKLLRRLPLGDSGSYSEAMWDEKALKVLPDAGLALIPLTSHASLPGEARSVVQLLDIDLKARDLRPRGKISHDFDARRADLIGDAVVSISQRVLVAADVKDRDAPSVLSEVSLAWPVDRVLEAGDYLFQIEDGTWYDTGCPTVRISPANAPEEILSETDLGEGIVKAADYRDGKLYVLRETGSALPLFYLRRVGGNPEENKLFLDIYDASAAPSLSLLGSCSMTPDAGGQIAGDHLLWPRPNRPAVLIDFSSSYWYRFVPVMMVDTMGSLAAASPLQDKPALMVNYRPYWVPEKAPQLILFDTIDPKAPVAADPVILGPEGSVLSGCSDAADGLLVAGISHYKDVNSGKWLDSGMAFQSARVVEVGKSGTPVMRPLIDLPGELFAVSELDANGFLAYTRTSRSDGATFQASACDGYDAFLIAGFDGSASAVAAAGGRRVFAATPDGVERHLLTTKGNFVTEPAINIGWTPNSLRWIQNTLTAASWSSVFATDGDGKNLKTWDFPTWNPGLERVTLATDGDLLVPFGEYGVERLDR